jgi:hypothetical protein
MNQDEPANSAVLTRPKAEYQPPKLEQHGFFAAVTGKSIGVGGLLVDPPQLDLDIFDFGGN